MTIEQAIKVLKEIIDAYYCDYDSRYPEEGSDVTLYADDATVLKMAIKALEQEPILDKIRAEIEALPKTYNFISHIDTYVKEDDVIKIIDKYKAER